MSTRENREANAVGRWPDESRAAHVALEVCELVLLAQHDPLRDFNSGMTDAAEHARYALRLALRRS